MDESREEWLSKISLANSALDVEEMVLKKLEDNPIWDEPFFVANLDLVLDKYRLWKKELPNVDVFYAMKANDDPMLLKLLVALGSSFDCSSKGEIETIVKMNVKPEKIMFSNPYKIPSHLTYASTIGVRWMVCDSVEELCKIKLICPSAKLVIRLNCRRETTSYPSMSVKFGLNYEEALIILLKAKKLNMNVEGISFYVGHCTETPTPFSDAIELSKEVFLKAADLGHTIRLLDIGGGFQGSLEKKNLFMKITATIRDSLKMHFPPEMCVRVVGEPGQFMGIAAFDVYCKVIGHRLRKVNGEVRQSVVLSGGHFSCVNNLVFKYNRSKIIALKASNAAEEGFLIKSDFWGPTCDPVDLLVSMDFQPLQIGSWLRITNLGAYTRNLMTNYNGFSLVPTKYFMSKNTMKLISDRFTYY